MKKYLITLKKLAFVDRMKGVDILTDAIIRAYKLNSVDLITDWELQIYDITYSNGIKLILE